MTDYYTRVRIADEAAAAKEADHALASRISELESRIAKLQRVGVVGLVAIFAIGAALIVSALS